MPSPERRSVYFAPVPRQPLPGALGAAARNKVVGICLALRAAGAHPTIVSAFRQDGKRGVVVSEADGIGYAETWSRGRGPLRRITAALALLVTYFRLIRRDDHILFYNYFPEYVPIALVRRLIGRPCMIDIEDGPADDWSTPGRAFSRALWHVMLALCSNRRLIVSHGLAQQHGIATYLPVYGVVDTFAAAPTERFTDAVLRVNLGGTMNHEMGVDLLSAAVRLLIARQPDLPIHVHVSGNYDPALFAAVAQEAAATTGIRVFLDIGLDEAAYRTMLERVDVGLSLRLVAGEIGRTTFPSKVIEIAARGMLLVKTSVSDVPRIFGDDEAVILPSDTPDALADALVGIAENRAEARERARRGRDRVHKMAGAQAVGQAILSFIDGRS